MADLAPPPAPGPPPHNPTGHDHRSGTPVEASGDDEIVLCYADGPRLRLADTQAAIERLDAAGPSGLTGGFELDPERAHAAIGILGKTLDNLRTVLLERSSTLMDVFPPPGMDHVSIRLAENAARMAHRASDYLRWYIAEIDTTVQP